IVPPAASSAAHRLPDTRWLTRARASQLAQGVAACQRSAGTPRTTRPVASSACACSAAISVMAFPPLLARHGLRMVRTRTCGLSFTLSPVLQVADHVHHLLHP